MKFYTILLCSLSILSACNFSKKKNDQGKALGKPGDVLVVCTDDLWLSGDLDSLFIKLAPAERPYYPTEYAFKFRQRNVVGFNSTYRATRNILIVERHNNAQYSPATINIMHDKWVKGQVVVEIFFKYIKDLKALTSQDLAAVTEAYEEAEAQRLISHYNAKANKTIQKEIMEKYGISLNLPTGVSIVNNLDDFMRIDIPDRSREMPLDGGSSQTSRANFILSYVLLWQREYTDESYFSREKILQYQDSILKKYAPHEKKGAYLTTEYDTVVYPVDKKFEINGLPMIEIKGQYRIGGRNDVFMGGPFVSYSFVNPKTSKIITLFGMVHGPSEPLLNYIREHKALIRTLKID